MGFIIVFLIAVWLLSFKIIFRILGNKNMDCKLVYVFLGPLVIYHLIKLKHVDSDLESFYKKIKKDFWKKSGWKYYNDIIYQIENSSLLKYDLKKLNSYLKADISSNKMYVNIISVFLGVTITLIVALSIYFLTNMDAIEQQQIGDIQKGMYSSTTITTHSLLGKEKTYDFFEYNRRVVFQTLISPFIIFSLLLLLQHIKITRNTIIINAIDYKINK